MKAEGDSVVIEMVRRFLRSSLVALAAVVMTSAACNSILGIGDPVDVPGVDASIEATADASVTTSDTGAGDAGNARDATDAAEAGVDAGYDAGICVSASFRGSPMVRALGSSFCIDAHEATQADYAAFLASNGVVPTNVKAKCVGNNLTLASFGPECEYDPATRGQYPIGCVDWCDAADFCAWAGKRLCGRVGGGPTGLDEQNTTFSQWWVACTHSGTQGWPYGSVQSPGTCNIGGGNPGPSPVGSYAGCQGGTPGLYDMSGNVHEWEDYCDGAGSCTLRGGSYGNVAEDGSCGQLYGFDRFATHQSVGFRCCSP